MLYYLKKVRKHVVLINLEGSRTNEPPYVFDKNVIPPELERKLCEKESRHGEGNDGPSDCLNVEGDHHESRGNIH